MAARFMKAETAEWVAKAEGDFADAQRGYRARTHPNPDGVCFHVQQCLEKYLKARLVEAGVSFPKSHDLGRILDLIVPLEPLWEAWRRDFNLIASFAVEYRYPGESATKEDARRTFRLCRTLRASLRESLGLSIAKA
jgi:HEPN domain-containing protein